MKGGIFVILQILNENRKVVTYATLITLFGLLECLSGISPWSFFVSTLQVSIFLLGLGLKKSVLSITGISYRIYFGSIFLAYSLCELVLGKTRSATAAMGIVVVCMAGMVVDWGLKNPENSSSKMASVG